MKDVRLQKISDGTVIDHVPGGKAVEVLRILGVGDGYSDVAAVLMNVESRKIGRKDVVKVENKYLSKEETDRLALVAPSATISLIKKGKVVKKGGVEVPKHFVGVVKCANPQCVTNHEPVATMFSIASRNPIQLKCDYCERVQ